MKLRGFSPSTAVLAIATLILLGSLLLKSKKFFVSDDMKSKLTSENTLNNPSKSLKNLIASSIKKKEEMTERVDFNDENLLVRERFYTEKEINDMSEEEFKLLVKETELKLPLLSDIKKLPPEALHRTPAPVMQAGKDLGLLKEVIKVHESYIDIAALMYERCSKNNLRPISVRALCLVNFIQYKKKYGKTINKADYPKELVDLIKIITD
jgi:hypothetical protein